jgi:hypothetical protein
MASIFTISPAKWFYFHGFEIDFKSIPPAVTNSSLRNFFR